jgi:hypothetical protein
MKIVSSLSEVPGVPVLAVIINCGTKLTTTLALASALAHGDAPVLLIDCESADGSRQHFTRLAHDHGLDFWWLDWPLRRHGIALDALLGSVQAKRVLLIDSDVEIRGDRVVQAMAHALDASPECYGGGMLHGPAWLGADHGLPSNVGYYAQRMWIPLVLLRTDPVVAALRAGASFAQRRAFTEIAGRPVLSRLLALRYWLPGLRELRIAGGERGQGSAPTPAFVEYDTGADMHQALCAGGYRFAAIDPHIFGDDVLHLHGVTRAARPHPLRKIARRLGLRPAENSVAENSVRDQIKNRLAERYGIRFA